MRRPLLLVLVTATAVSCSHSPTAPAPTAASLAVLVSPNPIAGPTTNANLVYNLRLAESGGLGVRLDRFEMKLADSAGHAFLTSTGNLSKSSGCSTCTTDMRVTANSTFNFGTFTSPWSVSPSGEPSLLCCGIQAASFTYTIYYTDDRGNALSSNVEVPIQ